LPTEVAWGKGNGSVPQYCPSRQRVASQGASEPELALELNFLRGFFRYFVRLLSEAM